MWKRIKAKARAAWRKVKLWVYALLVSLGIIVAVPTSAEVKTFTWTNPTSFVDGSALTPGEIQETRLFCDGDTTTPVIVAVGSGEIATGNFAVGMHDCFAVTVVRGLPSMPSNTVTFEVLSVPSEPPVLQVN